LGLPFVAVGQSVYIGDAEDRGTGTVSKNRYTPVEVHVIFSHATKEGIDKIIDSLSGLACEFHESSLVRRVGGNGGVGQNWHPPDLRPSSHK
jgi:hypothetical protein